MKRLLNGLLALFSSYGLAVTLLFFLFVLTFLGTWEQRFTSLYEVQRQFFDSTWLVYRRFGVPIPLPGVYLLLTLLSINLIVGGIVRIRKSSATFGILIAHVGIVTMLAGGLIEYHSSQKGHMTLHENGQRGPQQADEFKSYHEWEIVVAEIPRQGGVIELVIPGKQFIDLRPEATATFVSDELPFDVTVSRVARNSRVVPASQARGGGGPVIDGFTLVDLPQMKEAEQDSAGLYVTLSEKNGGARHDAILWAMQDLPWVVEMGARTYSVDLSRRRWKVPFSIVLDDFRKVDHPGTMMPASFESDVTKIEGGATERINISMNRPLRHAGYTLFQSGWGPQNAAPGTPLFSTFSVVRNPADSVPLWSCYVIAAGLLIHFVQKLVRHIQAENRRATA